MNFTKHTLKKLEDILEAIDYEILYGKGNFQSGYCIVEDQKKIVINRYFEVEARINSLVDIITQINFDPSLLDEKQTAFHKQIEKFILQRSEVQSS